MDVSADKEFRLVFHIGAGKTGTTSIQRSLRESRRDLHQLGYDYWGVMLEHAPIKKYSWQKQAVPSEFMSLPPQQASNQILDIIKNSVSRSRKRGINVAVWSHEWFFNKPQYVVPALQKLVQDGVGLEVVAYIRRHDLWARSAYIQWGIVHKTYEGPIKSFKEFVAQRPVRFAGALQRWKSKFPNELIIRNFDDADDVVQDFLNILDPNVKIPSVRVNETPGHEELLLRALFNNSIEGEVLPVEFSKIFPMAGVSFASDPVEWISSLLPEMEDLNAVWEEAEGDRQILNEWLVASGQTPLHNTTGRAPEVKIDAGKLAQILLHIVLNQNRSIKHLTENQKVTEK